MPSLKHIKQRLQSVKTTHKMVKAMKLVAGSHFRRAQNPLQQARHYETASHDMLTAWSENCDGEKAQACGVETSKDQALSVNASSSSKELVLICTSDRGLCGSFHSNMVRGALQHIKERQHASVEVAYWGQKGFNLGQRLLSGKTSPWQDRLNVIREDAKTHAESASAIAQDWLEGYKNKQWSRIWIVYGQFVSALVQRPHIALCLPVVPASTPPHSTPQACYEFEPDVERIGATIVSSALQAFLLRALCESNLSESAARMVAMDNASRNAEKLSQELALLFNRTRQALITKELMEIVVGAETLSK